MTKKEEVIKNNYIDYLNNIGEETSKYQDIQEQDIAEFINWEKNIQDGYIQNFIPYGFVSNYGKSCTGMSFGELDNDILIKAVQNDIRILLKTLGKGLSGEIKIKYANGRPEYMIANFESVNNKGIFEKLKKFVGNFGLLAYKKYLGFTKIYGEKLYRYTDKNWGVIISDSEKQEPFNYESKKSLKNNDLNI